MFGLALAACLLVETVAFAADTNSVSRPGGFQFDEKISREVLENYLSRSITMEGLLNGRGDLTDNTRMLKSIGAKYIGRALCLWNAENDFSNNVQIARAAVPKVLAADPEMILEACVFETVNPRVNQIEIPERVFMALGQPVEKRNFRYEDMIYPEGQRRPMGRNAQVPDESRIETRMWFYYQAITYIDLGCEGIHFGQVEIMNHNDPDNVHWAHLLGLVRDYAAMHARHHMVLCNGHVPTGGLMHDGNPLLDFHAFPLRIMETPDKPQEAILKLGFSDGIYHKSKGGRTFSGWTCDHLPYLVELDNYGVSRHPGEPNAKGEFNWVWATTKSPGLLISRSSIGRPGCNMAGTGCGKPIRTAISKCPAAAPRHRRIPAGISRTIPARRFPPAWVTRMRFAPFGRPMRRRLRAIDELEPGELSVYRRHHCGRITGTLRRSGRNGGVQFAEIGCG